MSTRLTIGVESAGYPDEDKTTDQVAEELEAGYGLFKFYFKERAAFVLQKVMDELMKGTKSDASLPAIADDFRLMIMNARFDGKLPNTPTGASMRRLDPNRPSFVDTGTFKTHLQATLKR